MIELKSEELNMVVGGSISGTIINAFVRGATTILDLGRYLGSAIRRIRCNSMCKV